MGSMERPDWDRYFLGMAVAAAARADCTRRRVGAVIVNIEKRIIGSGYNGGPMGGPSCLAGQCPRGLQTREQLPGYVEGNHNYDSGPGACIAIHAELNALLWSDYSERKGATIYITDEPCAGCWKAISNSGITRVVWPEWASLSLARDPMVIDASTVLCSRRRLANGRWQDGRGGESDGVPEVRTG